MSSTVLKETTSPKYTTNDIKMTAALITAGHEVVEVRQRENPRNRKTEIIFCFESNEAQNRSMMQFLSGTLMVDAKTILDNRDSLLSYVSNGSRDIMDKLNKTRVST